jgi:hypothetical protein
MITNSKAAIRKTSQTSEIAKKTVFRAMEPNVSQPHREPLTWIKLEALGKGFQWVSIGAERLTATASPAVAV